MRDRKTIAMKTFTVEYPESVLTTLKLSPESFEERARVAMAVKLFETGHLTSGQAAKLAGISRVGIYVTLSGIWNAKRHLG